MANNDSNYSALIEAFLKANSDSSMEMSELNMKIKDLNTTFKQLMQFLKDAGLQTKELKEAIKQSIDVQKEARRAQMRDPEHKGGITRGESIKLINETIINELLKSIGGKSKSFDLGSESPIVKAMLANIDSLTLSVKNLTEKQDQIMQVFEDLGGKLDTWVKGWGGGKDQGGKNLIGSGVGALMNVKGSSKKDTDIKEATAAKGDSFTAGIGTLINFLGSSGGFLGKLRKTFEDFFAKIGLNVLYLALLNIMGWFRRTFGKIEGFRNALKAAVKAPMYMARFLESSLARKLGLGKVFKAMNGIRKAAIHTTAGIAGKIASKVAGKSAGKAAEKVATKSLLKATSKVGGKGLGKALAKKIPGLSIAAGLAFGADRLIRDKDWKGAGLEVASGIAGTFAGVGTGVSAGIDAALIARDVKRAAEGQTKVAQEGFNAIENQSKIENDREDRRDSFWKRVIDWFKSICPWGKEDASEYSGGPTYTPTYGDGVYDTGNGKVTIGEKAVKSLKDRKAAARKFYEEEREKIELARGVVKPEVTNHSIELLTDRVFKEFGLTPDSFGGINFAGDAWKGLSMDQIKGANSNAFTVNGFSVKTTQKNAGQGNITAVALKDLKLNGKISSQEMPFIAAENAGRLKRLDNFLKASGYTFRYTSAMGGGHATGPRSHGLGHKVDVVIDGGPAGAGGLRPSDKDWLIKNGYIGNGAVGYHNAGSGYHWDLGIGPSGSSGQSSGAIPTYTADSRAVSEPKGTAPEMQAPQVAEAISSADDTSISMEDQVNQIANSNDFDQTGNTQFLAAINSIRVQLGKFQQIGMIT